MKRRGRRTRETIRIMISSEIQDVFTTKSASASRPRVANFSSYSDAAIKAPVDG